MREQATRRLLVDNSSIIGWTIRVLVDGLSTKTAYVQSVSKKHKGKPTLYKLCYQKPYPEAFPGGVAELCLDRKEPRSGKRVLLQGKKAVGIGSARFIYLKYPFVLVGSGPASLQGTDSTSALKRLSTGKLGMSPGALKRSLFAKVCGKAASASDPNLLDSKAGAQEREKRWRERERLRSLSQSGSPTSISGGSRRLSIT